MASYPGPRTFPLVARCRQSSARRPSVTISNMRAAIVNGATPACRACESRPATRMDRLNQQMVRWKQDDVPTLIGGDFNVIPEDIDCHKPSSWDARCFVSAGAASPLSCDVEYGLYGCVPVVARGRNWTLHVLGLLSAGVPKQSRHTNRSLLIILSPTLANRLEGCEIGKGPRAQEKPSDHTPIIVTLSDLR
jgi:exodeoxyribonuclease-3